MKKETKNLKEKKAEINIRLTENEKKKIQRNAKKCKLSLSAYLRKVGLKQEIFSVPDKEFYKIYLEISRLKNEIDFATNIEDIKTRLEQIKRIFLKIYNSKSSGENENGNN